MGLFKSSHFQTTEWMSSCFFQSCVLCTPTQLSSCLCFMSYFVKFSQSCPPFRSLPHWVMPWSFINSFISIFCLWGVCATVEITPSTYASLNKLTFWISSWQNSERCGGVVITPNVKLTHSPPKFSPPSFQTCIAQPADLCNVLDPCEQQHLFQNPICARSDESLMHSNNREWRSPRT